MRNAREGSGSNPTAGDAVDVRIADHQAKPAVSEASAPACSIEAGKVETDGEGSEPVQTNDTSCKYNEFISLCGEGADYFDFRHSTAARSPGQ